MSSFEQQYRVMIDLAQGTLFADVTSFEHTTLANLDPSTEYLWVHLILAFLFFPVAILVMRRFSVDVR